MADVFMPHKMFTLLRIYPKYAANGIEMSSVPQFSRVHFVYNTTLLT